MQYTDGVYLIPLVNKQKAFESNAREPFAKIKLRFDIKIVREFHKNFLCDDVTFIDFIEQIFRYNID